MNPSGILVVDKPPGVTSHDVIQKLRQILRTRRIGHSGTLDPAASGVLVVCVETATKVVQFLAGHDKEYEAKIRLGITTDSYDADGQITEEKDYSEVSTQEINRAAASFKGKIWQVPPAHSAIKHRGKKLYEYARYGQRVQIEERQVEIKSIEVMDACMPYINLRVTCSKGTYIRSLAHDLGQRLGCGAHLFCLRRTRVGPFKLNEAQNLEEISQAQDENRIRDLIMPIERALMHVAAVTVKPGYAEKVGHGIAVTSPAVSSIDAHFDRGQTISLKDDQGKIIAVCRALCPSEEFLNSDQKRKLVSYIRVI